MPTPFPGMDPYLEHPALWGSVHSRLIHCMANQLQPLLDPNYIASVEERDYVEETPQHRVPDIWAQKLPETSGGVAVAERSATAPLLIEVAELEVHEHYITILSHYQDFKVVAVIELISPSNKDAGPGRDSYLAKQREILASDCHLIEIDLLRRGRHVSSVPATALHGLGRYNYLACVNRAPRRRRFKVYPCELRDRLPRILIPVDNSVGGVPLDLQAALEQVYSDGRYVRRVRYDEPCEPPLSAEDQQWATECWFAYRVAHPELFPPAPPVGP